MGDPMELEEQIPDRWGHIYPFLERTGPFASEGFQPGDEVCMIDSMSMFVWM
jgi:hypothetical protein